MCGRIYSMFNTHDCCNVYNNLKLILRKAMSRREYEHFSRMM